MSSNIMGRQTAEGQDVNGGKLPMEGAAIAIALSAALDKLQFHKPSHVYNPTHYAWGAQQQFLQRCGSRRGRVLLVGMNPGPWGMAQTGVPFGEVSIVRDWLGISADLAGPLPPQHPKYPILGFQCHRSEGSGRRFWGWAARHFPQPEQFFERFFVWNYCPLLFIGNGRNLTPEQLPKAEREPLFAACDAALAALITALEPHSIAGIGRFAEARATMAAGKVSTLLPGGQPPVLYLHHPSPANPAANRNWEAMADATLGPWLN